MRLLTALCALALWFAAGAARAEQSAAPMPKYNFGITSSYLYQRLPGNSGEAGVVDLGGAAQALLRNPRELDGWTIGAWNTVWNVGPEIAGSAATVYLAGSYGQADGERSNSVGSDLGVVNGLTWWTEREGTSIIEAEGANLIGHAEVDYQTFEIRGGLKWDFPCGDGETRFARPRPRSSRRDSGSTTTTRTCGSSSS